MNFAYKISVAIVFTIILVAEQVYCADSTSEKKCRCGKTHEYGIAARVIGGTVMNEKAHPYLAMIVQRNSFCAGSIISSRYVLTAGHCIKRRRKRRDMIVTVGIHDQDERSDHTRDYRVEKIILHEKHMSNGSISLWDIALLMIEEKMEFNEYVQPICLPFGISVQSFKSAMVVGWGWMNVREKYLSRYPRAALLSILTYDQCKMSWLEDVVNEYSSVFLCAYHKKSDACKGDSGGPLLVLGENETYFQIGITSYGKSCGLPGTPAAYTRVDTFLPWIKKHVKDEICLP